MNDNITYISLGHRCHLASILKLNGQRKTSYPFDNIISKFEGVIDCIENNFQNFFPKNIVLEKIYVGKNNYEADEDGNRYLFRNKYFGFTHFNLLQKEIIEMFTRRIERFINYLTTTHDKVIFLRTIMENDELNYHNNFVNAMYKLNPCLQYKIIYVYDNINIPEFICRKKKKFYNL